jgi:putative membrane protein insertion efficiency factor
MKTLVLNLLKAYKRILSPLLPPACRFVPSCSDYAAEAVERHGFWCGGALAAWRLLRCHPFSRGGYDPVPDRCRKKAVQTQVNWLCSGAGSSRVPGDFRNRNVSPE